MIRASIDLPAGYVLEFWARGPGSIRISRGEAVLWQVPAFADHVDFFRYHHSQPGSVSVEWGNSDAMLFAYGYDPATVVEIGVTLWAFEGDTLTLRRRAEVDAWMRADPARPVLHFSPALQWMNDPNGLSKVGDCWHLFYQFHPASTEWGPMHWGHAVSRDLFNWVHQPVFLHPEQNLWRLGATGGAFSGSAFEDRVGSRMFFHTERLPAYDLSTGYCEVQKLARPDRDLLRAIGTETVIAVAPTEDGVAHDFRDPKVWWDEAAGAYRMVLGAALHGDPAMLLYGSGNLVDWTYLGPIFRAPSQYQECGARAVECPDFFRLGDKWVMVMSFVGYTEPASGRHNLLFALVGEFTDDRFIPDTGDLQLLDFGTDYYAMQSFAADGRQIALAWLFNWQDRKPSGSPYSGEMSLPRELRLDGAGRLCMLPVAELDATWPAVPLSSEVDGSFALHGAPLDLNLSGDLEGTRIVASQQGAPSFEVQVSAGRLSVRLPQDDGKIRYEAELVTAADLRILFDRGIIEVFADNGAICGTRRSYGNVAPDRVEVISAAKLAVSERSAARPA